MSQTPAERIGRVARLAAFEAEGAVRLVRETAAALDAANRQLADLRRFRTDYAASPAHAAAATGIALLNRHRFIERIDRAIAQKAGEVDACAERWRTARAAWLRERERSGALANVATRYAQAERANADRLEQAEADDAWSSHARTSTHQTLAGGRQHDH